MISLNWKEVNGEIGAMMARYAALPRHIAKKHLVAAVRRAGREGVPILRRNTPPDGVRRGRRKKGEKARSTGALRRAATVKAKYKGRNADGVAIGILGYKAGYESRKAIWMEFGTTNGIEPRRMIEKTMQQWKGPLASKLASEMAAALEKAVRELASGKNPGYRG